MSSGGGKSELKNSSTSNPLSARSHSSKDVSRPSSQNQSDGEIAKRSRERKTRTTSESSRDSSQGSSRNLKESKENVKEGKGLRRALSQGHKRNKSIDGDGGSTDRSKVKNKTEKVKAKDGAGYSSNDSGFVKDGGALSGSSGRGDTNRDVSEEEQSVSVDEVGSGYKTPRLARSLDPATPVRLLILSSKIKNSATMQHALLGNVVVAHYKYESSTLESLLGMFVVEFISGLITDQ